MAFLDCSILTLDELQQLASPFEVAFQVRMMASTPLAHSSP